MKAIVQEAYGPHTVLKVKDVDRPVAGDDQVLVRVRAASVNAGDCFMMRGKPFPVRVMLGLRRPRYKVPGWDLAYSLSETPAAMGYAAQGHVRGKVVITMDHHDA
jgi:NADPH:quinone reductase-like Zn-dependent oxidoreductase